MFVLIPKHYFKGLNLIQFIAKFKPIFAINEFGILKIKSKK